MSCNRVSINCTPRASRHTSFTWSSPPKDRRARLVASSRVMPELTYFSTRFSKWNRSSSSISVSAAFRRKRERRRINKSLNIGGLLNYLESWHSSFWFYIRVHSRLRGSPFLLPVASLWLFVAQGNQRIYTGGTARRNPTSQRGHDSQRHHHARKRERVPGTNVKKHAGKKLRENQRRSHTCNNAGNHQQHSLTQKQAEYLAAPRAERHANPNFAGASRDRI